MNDPSDIPSQNADFQPLARRSDATPVSTNSQSDVPPPIDINPGEETGGLIEYWHIIRRRKGTVVLFACLGILAGLLTSLPQTPIYQARGTLEILQVNENLLNRQQLDPNSVAQDYDPEVNLRTQMSVLQSRSLASRVEAKMRAAHPEGWPEPENRLAVWRKVLAWSLGRSSSRAQKQYTNPGCGLGVEALQGTRVVEISCDSASPDYAAEFVNTLAEEFIDQNVEVRYQASQRTGEWLKTQLDDLKIKLEKSENDLQESARVMGLQFTGEKDNVSEEKLKQVQEELSKAEADLAAKQPEYELADSADAENLPEILDDKVIDSYQSKLADLRQQLAELSTALTPEHYKVQRVQAQMDEIENALARQRATVIARIRNEYQAALRRDNLLAAEYKSQSAQVTDQAQSAIHYNILKQEVDSTRQLYEGMLQNVKQYSIASAMQASNVRVMDPATPPGGPYKPEHGRNAGVGLIAGLMLGIAFVIIRDRADRSIQAPGETARYIRAPELGVIPSAALDAAEQQKHLGRRLDRPLSRRAGADEAPSVAEPVVELATSQRGAPLVSESIRTVLASILFSAADGNHPRVVVLSSPAPKEGKTTITANLGLALAEIDCRVLIIDADFRRPRLHKIFDVPPEPGIADILRNRDADLNGSPIGVETAHPGLRILPAGSDAYSSISFLYSPRLKELLNRARREFDMVFIDSPPMINMSDARVIGRLSDGVVLVIRAGRTTRDAVLTAAQRFGEDGTPILGTVLNDWDPKKNAGYGYGYAYRSYGHYYTHYYKHYTRLEDHNEDR